jgi:hypothetical protein
MENADLIDYAYPMMMAERKLKEAHNVLLDNDYDKGVDCLIQALAEVRLAIHSVRHMRGDHQ